MHANPIFFRIFHVIVSKLEEMFERDTPGETARDNQSISPDDYKECYYLLRTASNIISILSHNGWMILLSHTLGQTENRPDTAKSEGKVRLSPNRRYYVADTGNRQCERKKSSCNLLSSFS